MEFYRNFRRKRIYRSVARKIQQQKKFEALAEIDWMTAAFGDQIPYLRSLRTDLITPVQRSLRYLGSMVGRIPGPVAYDPARWNDDPLLNSMCISEEGLRAVIYTSESLQKFFEATAAVEAYALLTAEKREKTVSGIEKEGDIVRRDVLQKAVFFENHEILVPAGNLKECRRLVRRLLLAGIFRQVADQIADLKSWKLELRAQHDRIEAKLGGHAASHRSGARQAAGDRSSKTNAARLHDAIEEKLSEIKGKLDAPADYLTLLTRMLVNPKRHLKVRRLTLKLSRLGIRLSADSSEPANQICLAALETAPDDRRVAVFVRVPKRSRRDR